MTSTLERAIAVHAEWLAQRHPVPVAALLAAHPDLADVLVALVADHDEVDRSIALADGEQRELGDFRLLAEIGRGGMGVVYRARQLSLDREVALKVLTSHVTRHPAAVARFRREATLAARLEHPNVVAIHAVGVHGDAHFFAMELIEGGTLTRRDPVTGERRSVRATVELCAKVADALAYAHAEGVLHRDVKPSNILVRRDGEPVLSDFGLARQLDDPGITHSGQFAGTPWYASPEQLANSKSVDARADVWSLGATLYELLIGKRPFPGDSAPEVIELIRTSEPADPVRLVPDLAPDLAAIVMMALEKAPERRYASAAALRDDLRAFLDYRPVAARRVGRLTRAARWLQRHPGWRAALLLSTLALFVVPVIVSFAVTGERDRAVAAEQVARRKAYSANLVAANTALANGDGATAAQLLAACPEELRSFEWRLVARGLDRALWTVRAHRRPVTAVALSADARWLAAAAEGGEVVVFDTRHGTEVWRRPASDAGAPVIGLAFTVGDDAVLTADANGALQRHAAGSGDVLATVPGCDAEVAVAMRTDGDGVVRCPGPGRFEVYDAGLRLHAEHTLTSAVDRPRTNFVSDGARVVGTPQLGGFVAWDLLREARGEQQYYGSQPTLLSAADGLARIVGFDARTGFAWWDRASGSLRRMHHGARQITCLDVAPDGRWLVAGGRRGEIFVHDLEQARLVRVLHGHGAAIGAVAIGAAGWLASGASDGTIEFWNTFHDAGAGEVAGVGFAASLSGTGFGRSLAVAADGSLFTGGLDGTVRCIDPGSGALRWQRQLPHWTNGIAVLGGGQEVLVSWHDRLLRLAAHDGTALGEARQVPGLAYVRRFAVAPDGRRCAMLDESGAVAVFDAGTRSLRGPRPVGSLRTGLTGGLVWAPDETLWVGDEDGAVLRVEATSLEVRARFAASAAVTAMAGDGTDLLIATWDRAARTGSLQRLDPTDGQRSALAHLPSQATAIALIRDRIVLSRWDGRLGVYDRSDLTPVLDLPQPAPAVWNVVAHEPGDWLAIQCYEGEPRVLAARETAEDPTERRERALRAAASHLATEALTPTGWPPHAQRAIAARIDLPADLRDAAIAALPPAAAWRLRDIAVHHGFAVAIADAAASRLDELRECLLEAMPPPDDEHAAEHRVVLALVEYRCGDPEGALAQLRDLAPESIREAWWAFVCRFVLCSVHAARGETGDAVAALDAMRTTLPTLADARLADLLREAEENVARSR